MITLDGIEYQIEDAATNAATMVTAINDYCEVNDITNSKGERMSIGINWSNPLYAVLYGVGHLASYLQSLIYSAGCALNIGSASSRQLLNIADVADVKRKEASRTTIRATVYSNLTDSDAVECRVTTTDGCTVNTAVGSVVFYPAFDLTIPIGSSATVVLIADQLGSFVVPSNTLTFDAPPQGFRTMTSDASVPGQDVESIEKLRQRLQRRTQSGTMLDRCKEALSSLPGVSVANVYYNQSATQTETMNDIEVPPRYALIFVQGFSLKIAETFYRYFMCPVAGAKAPGAIEQTYVTASGQELTVYIQQPVLVTPHIRVYCNNSITDAEKQVFRDTIASLARNLTIGQSLASTDVINILQTNHPDYEYLGCELSLDGISYSYKIQPGEFQLLSFVDEAILIQGTEN